MLTQTDEEIAEIERKAKEEYTCDKYGWFKEWHDGVVSLLERVTTWLSR